MKKTRKLSPPARSHTPPSRRSSAAVASTAARRRPSSPPTSESKPSKGWSATTSSTKKYFVRLNLGNYPLWSYQANDSHLSLLGWLNPSASSLKMPSQPKPRNRNLPHRHLVLRKARTLLRFPNSVITLFSIMMSSLLSSSMAWNEAQNSTSTLDTCTISTWCRWKKQSAKPKFKFSRRFHSIDQTFWSKCASTTKDRLSAAFNFTVALKRMCIP